MTTDELREFLETTLPKAARKKIDAILDHLGDLLDAKVGRVEDPHGCIGVETVELYGLSIEVDAVGNASAVELPYGEWVAA